MAMGTFRKTVLAGGWTYAWRPPTPGLWSLVDAGGKPVAGVPGVPGAVGVTWWNAVPQNDTKDKIESAGVTFPVGLAPGAYSIRCGLDVLGVVNLVAALPSRAWIAVPHFQGGDDAAAIQQKLDAGFNVQLTADAYTLARAIRLPPGAQIAGVGRYATVLTRTPDSDYHSRMFVVGTHNRLSGFTAVPGGSDGYLLHSQGDGSALNLTLQDVYVDGGNLGADYGAGACFRECLFECGSRAQSGSFWFSCTFRGVGNGLLITGADGVCGIGLEFQGTDRGIVLRGQTGPVTNCLFSRVLFENIAWVGNGCETIGIEGLEDGTGGPGYLVSQNSFHHVRYRGCVGCAVQMYNCATEGNVFRDLEGDTAGIWMDTPASDQPGAMPGYGNTGNYFEHLRLRGGRIVLGKTAKNNSFKQVAWSDPCWAEGSAMDVLTLDRYEPGPVFSAKGPGNYLATARVRRIGGLSLNSGFILQDVKAGV